MAEIIWFDIRQLNTPEKVENAWINLSEERRLAADRRKADEDRLRSIAAGTLIEDSLRRADIMPPYHYVCSKRGKPHVEGAQHFHFNVSHSGSYAVIAVSKSEVGVDIEEIDLPRVHRSMTHLFRSRFISDAVSRWIESGSRPEIRFLELWTLAEALGKCLDINVPWVLENLIIPRAFEDTDFHIFMKNQKINVHHELENSCVLTVAELDSQD